MSNDPNDAANRGMSRDEGRRYVSGLWYAVHEKDLTFDLAEEFASWWTRVGWMFHREIRDGFLNWSGQTFPRAVPDDPRDLS